MLARIAFVIAATTLVTSAGAQATRASRTSTGG
jgi:hypothetical protein